MIEDDHYRSTTQYRHWSFTPTQLSSLRQQTNDIASQKVREAYARAHDSTNGASTPSDTFTSTGSSIETLTPAESLLTVRHSINLLSTLANALNPKPSTPVICTAIQYLKRFYLHNSPMTYHPSSILVCCLFLAFKADHVNFPIAHFVQQLNEVAGDVTVEKVKSPEFLVMQGLRFELGVVHSFQGLEGGMREMVAFVKQKKMRVEGGVGRVAEVGKGGKRLLSLEAQVSDVCFLGSPSQVWLGCVFVVDREVGREYLRCKFGELEGRVDEVLEGRVRKEVERCAELIKAVVEEERDEKKMEKEMKRIGRKLKRCQHPDKVDIVAVTKVKKSEKREGSESEVEAKKKKRKLEMERDEQVFGEKLKDLKKDDDVF